MELEHKIHMDALRKQLDEERISSAAIVDKIDEDTSNDSGEPVVYEVR